MLNNFNTAWALGVGIQLIYVVVMIGFLVFSIYVLILLVRFLKAGTKAFEKYLHNGDEE